MQYLNYTAVPITWTKIGSCPLVNTYAGSMNPPTACIVNGKFSMLYCLGTNTNPIRNNGAVLYSWDEQGNRCQYNTTDFAQGKFSGSYVVGSNIHQTGNTFVYSFNDGSVFRWVIPPIFTPGGIYTVPATAFNAPNPCGGGSFQSVTYLQQQNLIAYEFTQAFSLANNFWASIYDTLNNFQGGGFIGNANTPIELFNRVVTTLPPNTFPTDLFNKNGFNFYSNAGNAGNIFQNVGFNQPYLNGDPSSLVCGGSGNPNVYISAINQFQAFPYRDYGCPSFQQNSSQIARAITDKPGYFLMPDSNLYLISRDWMIGLHTLSVQGCYGYLSKTNKLYCQVDTSGSSKFVGDIYIADFPKVNIDPLPIVTRAYHAGLANYHRAVSPDGKFQA